MSKDLGFEPTQKELDAFAKEKMDIYKGTFVVCLVYGIVAVALLSFGFFTSWGREYIFDKMLPATTTFVFGALFIIIYLSMSIYDMKPKQIKNKIDKDNGLICPDYWTLKAIDVPDKTKYITNNGTGDAKILTKIVSENDNALKYKCEYTGPIGDKNDMKEDARKTTNKPTKYYNGYTDVSVIPNKDNNDYIIITRDNNYPSYKTPTQALKDYAQFSGLYKTDNTNGEYGYKGVSKETTSALADSNNLFITNNDGSAITANDINDKAPLICNMVLPQVLELYDKDTPEKNKYRCEYAKACNVPWTEIGCPV